jgi:hypothetical protein
MKRDGLMLVVDDDPSVLTARCNLWETETS